MNYTYDDIDKAFKLISYDLEAYSNREWIVDQIHTETYPNSYIYTTFKNSTIHFLCNNKAFIFALNDTDKGRHGNLNACFVYHERFAEYISEIMKHRDLEYNFLKPDFLTMKFYNKAEFDQKIIEREVRISEVAIALKILNLDLFNYQLFHGVNIGYELFNAFDD
ncbi:MAG: hypothetical protein ACXWDO_09915 [Bacteroidia bacterium]